MNYFTNTCENYLERFQKKKAGGLAPACFAQHATYYGVMSVRYEWFHRPV